MIPWSSTPHKHGLQLYDLDYKASTVQWHAERRAKRPKVAKLVVNDRLRDYVQQRLSGEVRDADGAVIGPVAAATLNS